MARDWNFDKLLAVLAVGAMSLLFLVVLPGIGYAAYNQRQQAAQRVEQLIERARTDAKSAQNAWLAREVVMKALLELDREREWRWFWENHGQPAFDNLSELQWQYFIQAAKQKSPEALKLLWATHCEWREPCSLPPQLCWAAPADWRADCPSLLRAVRNEYAATTTAIGRQTDDPELLRLTGQILLDGRFVPRDTAGAIEILERSYRLGHVPAAVTLAKAYASLNDWPRAYLWSVRCTQQCERDDGTRLETLRQHLTPAQVLAAEAEARGLPGALAARKAVL